MPPRFVQTGKVVANIVNPVVCDEVSIKVRFKESTFWDEEWSTTRWEGEGDRRKAITDWHHERRWGKDTLLRAVIVVSRLDHVLPPGTWQYPFSYPIPTSVPGCGSFFRRQPAHDPHWGGRSLEFSAQSRFTLKACLNTRGVFSRDLRSVQEVCVNPYFDWAKMSPAKASAAGQVLFLCCIPKGNVLLNVAFDKAAYAAGETARIAAVIDNQSTSQIKRMEPKLKRTVTLRSSGGQAKTFHDKICEARYEGVAPKSTATRELPLELRTPAGFLLSSLSGRLFSVSYEFEANCDIPWAPDIAARLPVTIYQPAPAVWGMAAAFGSAGVPAVATQYVVPVAQPVVQQQYVQQPVVQQQYVPQVVVMGGAGAMPMGAQTAVNPMVAAGVSASAPGMGGMASPMTAPGMGGMQSAPGMGGMSSPGMGGMSSPGMGGMSSPGMGGMAM